MISAISQPRERKVGNGGGVDAQSSTCSTAFNAHAGHHKLPLHSMAIAKVYQDRYASKGKYELSWRSRVRIVGNKTILRMRSLCGRNNCWSKVHPLSIFFRIICFLAPILSTLRWCAINEKIARFERSKNVAEKMGWIRRPMLVKCCADNFSSVGISPSSSLAYQNNLSIQQYRKTVRSIESISFDVGGSNPIQSSEDYDRNGVPPFVTATCKEQYDWQLETHSNCNSIHEFGLEYPTDEVELINGGFWRDIWRVTDVNGAKQVLKTLKYVLSNVYHNY